MVFSAASRRPLSRSHAATIWQSVSLRKLLALLGPIMPQPMTAMVMRLDGAFCPKTLEGTIVGKPKVAAAAAPDWRNRRREVAVCGVVMKAITRGPDEFLQRQSRLMLKHLSCV